MPAPPSDPPPENRRDSREISMEAVLGELHAKGEAVRKAEAEKAELAAELETARRAPTLPQDVPTRAMWHSSLFKLLGVLTLLGAAATGWIEVHTANVSTHVDNLAAKQVAQEVVTDPLPARVAQLEAYLRLKLARDDCVEGELRSALDRATGHAVTALHETAVQWVSESMPPARAPLLWPRTIWFPSRDSDCPPEPRPP